MASFTCRRCGYETKYKHVLVKHLERTKTCDPKLDDVSVSELLKEFAQTTKAFKCACGKSFSHDSSLSRHVKACTYNQIDDQKDLLLQEMQETLHSVQQELCSLKSRFGNSQTHIHGNNNVNNITTINNTYVVVLNNFGSEDVSHILDDKQFLDDCLLKLQNGIPNVVNKIYYDATKPENKTVLLKSAKRKTALVHSNGKWEEKDLNEIVPIMVTKGSNILSNHLQTIDVSHESSEKQEALLAKHMFMADIITRKKPEYDLVSSAIKANICNHR